MKAKVKLGLGVKVKKNRKGKSKKRGGSCQNFKAVVKKARDAIKKAKKKTLSDAVAVAVKSLKSIKKNVVKIPRVIPLPKTGGFLPLIPLLTGYFINQ